MHIKPAGFFDHLFKKLGSGFHDDKIFIHTPVNETVAQEECGQAAEQVEERTEVPQHEVQLLPLFIRGQRPPKQRPTLAANRGEHS